jgi:hypothetical protein
MVMKLDVRRVGDLGELPDTLPVFLWPQVPLNLETLAIIFGAAELLVGSRGAIRAQNGLRDRLVPGPKPPETPPRPLKVRRARGPRIKAIRGLPVTKRCPHPFLALIGRVRI